ncbi:Na+/H+ antiporter NhaA [Candidatus Mycolicibacterium alkanivorans]|uniref:Na(+)/H(+) antiporter NhaA n=1 Tax=Candidatus Mycolicibacterium alkanivorans TaxID=2954114 RepID=A0ABS9YZW8_9MYCO|nr:Na+/H+ antiporter NhaA [Candidatus Mycolicibacterium alkanivorans]MCI4676263.1 Na+/H+ antiporter NhaA [Candidatus Mycolicibacterium alkanivorans]
MADRKPLLRRALFSRGSWSETSRITAILRKETVGGALLLFAAAVALIWANSAWSASYHNLTSFHVGTDRFGLHLDLTLGGWAADGLLAIFFFVVGLELKREFVAGDLRDPGRAALPIAAAVGGMVVPAAIFVAFTADASDGAVRGWAIPTATDIAFAVAALAVISTHLPSALRTFLLTLAVVDDLLAITVIAVFYTEKIKVVPLLVALIPLTLFAILVQRRIRACWLLIPLAALTWVFVHESGVHATVAGVLLGFTVPVLRSEAAGGPDAGPGLAEHFEHLMRPVSAGFAVPVFAFFAAGVTFGGYDGLVTALRDPIALGIVGGLVVGKTIGVFGTTWVLAAITRASLDSALRWIDVFGMSMLAGIGFTVSLLTGDLAYDSGSARDDVVKVAVLTGSLLAALLAAIVLRLRNRHYRSVWILESRDRDHDGVPDVYESGRD